ncbi:hypothetical protein KQI82_00130 [Oscillibacter sp. MSJ-2]|uniref:Uncharacterized protein n=1 Tax=Dysosmobacter acutus TaxID=2841504 RepID=A0ABS6F4Z7_9FIRM|nr:hypothetical protein [Dysosmobacter acutus]MBU5625341.1 hypothetical protein [Dysosmobacter acutus]
MKKRMGALILALALCLPLVTVSAADTVYFTSMNDSLMGLSDSAMPYWSGGYLYVPASNFNGRDINVYYSRSADKQTIILYSGKRALSFDLGQDATYDSYGNIYAERAQLRGGTPYVPVARVASFFDLTYTNTKVDHGYLVRVRDGNAMLDDREFIEAAGALMDSRYNEYKKAGTPSTPVVPEPPVTGTAPGQTGEEDPGTVGNRLYLCFLVTDVPAAEQLVSVLSANQAQASFYIQDSLLPSAGDLARRLTASGFSVGLAADGAGGAEEALERLREGNELLFRACGMKTRLALVTGASAQTAERIGEEGFLLLQSRVEYTSLTSSARASALQRRIGSRGGNVTVYLGSQTTAAGLRAFLSLARGQEDRLLAMTETT